MEWVAHYGPQDVQLGRMFSSQDVQLGDGEIVGMEASGPPETMAGGRRALGVDILRRLKKECHLKTDRKKTFKFLIDVCVTSGRAGSGDP